MMALSDVFKEDGEKFFSYVMIFSAGFFIFQNFFELQHIRKNTVHNTTHGSLFTYLSTAFNNPFIDVIVKGH